MRRNLIEIKTKGRCLMIIQKDNKGMIKRIIGKCKAKRD